MKTSNALVAAALAGVFAAGATIATAAPTADVSVVTGNDQDKCPDKDQCPDKDKKEEEKKEGTIL